MPSSATVKAWRSRARWCIRPATGVVVATGSETELGRINQLLAGVSSLETPLLRQIKKFGYAITGVVAVIGVLVFAFGRWVRTWTSSSCSRRSWASRCR